MRHRDLAMGPERAHPDRLSHFSRSRRRRVRETRCAFAANVRQVFYATGMANNFTVLACH